MGMRPYRAADVLCNVKTAHASQPASGTGGTVTGGK